MWSANSSRAGPIRSGSLWRRSAAPCWGTAKYGRGDVNRRYGETRQALYSYKLRFAFPTDAGMLNYLRGKEFTVEDVPFRGKYFPGED